MKKNLLLLCLLACLGLTERATAQLMLGKPEPSEYRLADGTTGTAKLVFMPNSEGQLVVFQGKEKVTYTPEQVSYFIWGGLRFEPVYNFSVQLSEKRAMDVARDFAAVLDTGRVKLLEHQRMASRMGGRSGLENRVSTLRTFLLQPRGSKSLIAIPGAVTAFDDGKFSPEVEQQLLQIFGNDAALQSLIAQKRLSAKSFPDYVRAYNQRARQKS